jgi:peptide/nickel transport system substrate-binding protein
MNGIVFADLVSPDTYRGSKWADPRTRQAVAHAIDQKQLVEKIYFNKAVAVAVPWAVPGIPGIDPALKPYAYDPQKARQLLAAAGHPNGLEIEIFTYASAAMAGNPECAQAVGGYLESVGIRNKVNPIEYATFLENQRAKRWAGTGALMVVVQGGRAGESFQPSLSQKGSTPYYYDTELEALADKQLTVADPKEREKMIAELSRKLYETVANVPLVSSNYMQGLGEKIKGWVPRVRSGFDLGMEYIELKG